MRKEKYAIVKFEIELKVLAEELLILEGNTRRMDLPQLFQVWQPEILTSKMYIQLKDIGEEKNAKRKRQKKKGVWEGSNTDKGQSRYHSEIQYGGVSDPAESMESGEGEGTYISEIRQRIRNVLNNQKEIGGSDREGADQDSGDE